jgi:hypothetical protein
MKRTREIIKIWTKGDEVIDTCKFKINNNGSFILPWYTQKEPVLIEAKEMYEEIIPFFQALTDDELKEIFIQLWKFNQGHSNYTASLLQCRAIQVLNERRLYFFINGLEYGFETKEL